MNDSYRTDLVPGCKGTVRFVDDMGTLKTVEISGKMAKIRHFPYRKQNSIAEIASTMESFLADNPCSYTMHHF